MSSTIDLTNLPERNGVLDLPDDPSDYADPTPVQGTSDLDLIRQDLTQTFDELVTVPVNTRPGYSLRCVANVSGDELESWRKAAKSKRHADGVDGVKLTALIIANKATEILRGGELLTDSIGQPLNFRHNEFRSLLKQPGESDLTAADAVRRFFGKDGALDTAARTVLVESGWGDDALTVADPTAGGW